MSLAAMCLDDKTSILEISQHLNALNHQSRMVELFTLGPKHQARLFQKAAASPALTLDFFVPQGCSPLTQVIHHGKNSLPAFRYFQKRFCLPQGGPPRLFGYNETSIRHLVGPGYFVAYSTEEYPTLRERGGVVIDYYRTPDSRVAPGWPTISPTDQGLQSLVYGHMQDFMRGVSEHVSIGAAWRKGTFINSYFILCREAFLERKAIEEDSSKDT